MQFEFGLVHASSGAKMNICFNNGTEVTCLLPRMVMQYDPSIHHHFRNMETIYNGININF